MVQPNTFLEVDDNDGDGETPHTSGRRWWNWSCFTTPLDQLGVGQLDDQVEDNALVQKRKREQKGLGRVWKEEDQHQARALLRDMLMFMGGVMVYFVGAVLSKHRHDRAMRHAHVVATFEEHVLGTYQFLRDMNQIMQTDHPRFVRVGHAIYIYGFLVYCVGSLLYCRYRMRGRTWRRFWVYLCACCVSGWFIALLFPCAPPRMLFTEVENAAADQWHKVHSLPLTNAYSAVPSLHTIGVFTLAYGNVIAFYQHTDDDEARHRIQLTLVALANATFAVSVVLFVLVTAAHFFTDVLLSFVVMAFVLLATLVMWGRERARWQAYLLAKTGGTLQATEAV